MYLLGTSRHFVARGGQGVWWGGWREHLIQEYLSGYILICECKTIIVIQVLFLLYMVLAM